MRPPLRWLQDDGNDERVTELQQIIISLRYEALTVTHPPQRSETLLGYYLDYSVLRTIPHRIWNSSITILWSTCCNAQYPKECEPVAVLRCDALHTHKNSNCDLPCFTASSSGFNAQFPKEIHRDYTVMWL